jgi:hypothetical protein
MVPQLVLAIASAQSQRATTKKQPHLSVKTTVANVVVVENSTNHEIIKPSLNVIEAIVQR